MQSQRGRGSQCHVGLSVADPGEVSFVSNSP